MKNKRIDSSRRNLENEIRMLKKKNEDKRNNIKSLKETNHELQNEISSLKTQILKLKIENDEISFQLKLTLSKTKFEQFQHQTNEIHETQIQSSNNNHNIFPILKEEIQNSFCIISTITQHTTNNESNNDLLQKEIELLQTQVKAKENFIDKLNDYIYKQKNTFDKELEVKNKKNEELIKHKNNEITQLKSIIENNTSLISSLQIASTQNDFEYNSLKSKHEFINTSYDKLKKENYNLLIQNKNLKQIINSNELMLNELHSQNEQFILLKNELTETKNFYELLQTNVNQIINKTYTYINIKGDTITFKIQTLNDVQTFLNELLDQNNKIINENELLKKENQNDKSIIKVYDNNNLYIENYLNNITYLPVHSGKSSEDNSYYLDKIKVLEANYASAKKIIDSLKESNAKTSTLLKERIEENKQLHNKLNQSGNVDINYIKTAYTKLQGSLLNIITSISPNVIGIEFTSVNNTTLVPVDKYIELLKKFTDDINKKLSKVKKYKEMLKKLSLLISEEKKELSTVTQQKTDAQNKVTKLEGFISNIIKEKLLLIINELQNEGNININDIEVIIKEIIKDIDLQDKEIKNISTLEDTYLNETNKHSISLNNDSFLNLSSISTESKSSFFSKFNQINSNEAEIYDKKLEEVEKMYRENISELQNELNKAKKEIELLKKGENVSSKMSPELKKGVENLIFSIKIKKKNKAFMVNIMKQIGYSDDEIQQILKKNGEMQE